MSSYDWRWKGNVVRGKGEAVMGTETEGKSIERQSSELQRHRIEEHGNGRSALCIAVKGKGKEWQGIAKQRSGNE